MCVADVISIALVVAIAGLSFGQDGPAVPHQRSNFVDALKSAGQGNVGVSQYRNARGPICTTVASIAPNVNTDCEGVALHNEATIAANPRNWQNQIGTANDYQLRLTPGGRIVDIEYSRAHVTFNGGTTWTTYPIDYKGYAATGDSSVAFDADGTAYIATLGFVWNQAFIACCTYPDILVTHSKDGGQTWSKPSRVANGAGFGSSVTDSYNDKGYLTAWGHGNAIVTWTVFKIGVNGRYINSVIYDSITHDGGVTWSKPQPISGSASFCLGSRGDTTCDQDTGSQPVVASDGSIFVSFISSASTSDYHDQYIVVRVDSATGVAIGGPYKVAEMVDGIFDYPTAFGRQTYQDSLFRTWALGAVASDPTNAEHLAVVWSDMRNSPPLVSFDPYENVTDSDIIVSESVDGGTTWSSPIALRLPHDQFMPWAAYDAIGRLRIGFYDRSYDPANHKYGFTLATETSTGTLTFNYAQVTTALSDPTQGNLYGPAATLNANFPNATTFLGDYSNIGIAGNNVISYWTDLREDTALGGATGYAQEAYYASGP